MLRTPVFKCLQIGVVVLLVLAFTISSVGAQPAQAASATKVSNGWMPFTGSLHDTQTDSNIHLNGLVHIVTRWKPVSASEAQLDVHVNLAADHVTVTTDTGIPYIAIGAGQSSGVFIPSPPPIRLFVPSFRLVVDRLVPPNPIVPPNPVKPFGLQLDLVFDAAGALNLDASTVQVIELRTEE